jgi:uncharacterized radical SAM protein YgiQ
MFLPVTKKEMGKRGWDVPDIVLVTGDAYVDHPSYGAALISRLLESKGYKVAVIAQPEWRNAEDFKRFGRPKLFFAITSGNVDSMISNYTAGKKRRATDDYSPGGKSGKRPDRAVIVYSNRAREAFPGVSIVLGGVEASLRRFAHYDYWDDRVRRSVLLDAKADILVYGMAERAILEIAEKASKGIAPSRMDGVRGTVIVRKDLCAYPEVIKIPSFEEVSSDLDKFNEAFKGISFGHNPMKSPAIAQEHTGRYVVQIPPAKPLSTEEMDALYVLPFEYAWHPSYSPAGGVKAFETVRFSITAHRGCSAECSFCGIHLHQGRIVQSRSAASIIAEAARISRRPDFKGTVSDIGGPTANMYGARCKAWEKEGPCQNKSCLVPEKCPGLRLAYDEALRMYGAIASIPGVKNVFIGSGFRHDLLTDKYSEKYLEQMALKYIGGQMKVAPEHVSDKVLEVMNKPRFETYRKFLEQVARISERTGKKIYLANYFISAHPGAGLKEALEMSLYLLGRGMSPEQVQDFIPLPMTFSAAIYHTGKHPFSSKKVHVQRTPRERKMQRALAQYRNPSNLQALREALKELNAEVLQKKYFLDSKKKKASSKKF